MDVLIVGGFEPSGHDSTATALAQAAVRRGHRVHAWNWREVLPGVDTHPVFHLHRRAIPAGAPHACGILDSEAIPEALGPDLAHLLPDPADYDVVLSAHPWSTAVAITAMESVTGTMLVDCHGEFAPFPNGFHERVDLYVGGRLSRSVPAWVRRRCVPTGVPVRAQFGRDRRPKEPKLVLLGGSAGHAITETARLAAGVAERVGARQVVAIAPNDEVASSWRTAGIPDVAVEPTDISSQLADATWLITKASGPPVAEGLASGCQVLCPPSGVFWEDEARAYLSAERVVHPLAPLGAVPSRVDVDVEAARRVAQECVDAGSAIWTSIEQRFRTDAAPTPVEPAEVELLARLRAEALRWPEENAALPAVSAALADIIDKW
ncbi:MULTISPECIES: hypothetical protein [Saccharothrix]|uniref:hypothetical protein n=1 Tax=Saccharothrix TaxID=2071 RepID=UPI000939C7FB|nr:hypothetical protein [Saccharothrix sp. CB00851]OKI32493.1 hypothetical protein A6A25_25565 [Saccharothrix sp. CB00851]